MLCFVKSCVVFVIYFEFIPYETGLLCYFVLIKLDNEGFHYCGDIVTH
jgi:hypothetical protein